MAVPIKIDIVSDVSCPWCIIGYRALDMALNNVGDQVKADIHWQPFELNPNMPVEGQELREHIQEKYGATAEQSVAARQMIVDRGAEVGFDFNFQEGARIYNTFDAHRLLYWAEAQGRQTELKLAFFNLYFCEAGNPSSHQDLCKAVKEVGLDADEALATLQSDRYSTEVRELQQRYRSMNITAVPAFILNDKYLINGGQPVEVFETAINNLLNEKNNNAVN